MTKFVGKAKEVLDTVEIVRIGTCDEGGAHLVATWGDYVRTMGIQEGDVILIPAGGYHQTEKNLRGNPRVEVLLASQQAGTGFRLIGRAEVQTDGNWAERVKDVYGWARGALVVHVEEVEKLL